MYNYTFVYCEYARQSTCKTLASHQLLFFNFGEVAVIAHWPHPQAPQSFKEARLSSFQKYMCSLHTFLCTEVATIIHCVLITGGVCCMS